MSEQPPIRVMTGGADDGRHRARQLVAGALGWLLWAALIVWLALRASPDALHVATFLATVVVTVAVLTVLSALALRPAVMRRRAGAPAIEAAVHTPPAEGAGLAGEVAVRVEGSVRTYVSVQESET